MLPVQKVIQVYKSSMDLKDKNTSQALFKESDQEKNSYSNKDSKNSFQSILKKTMGR